MNQRNLRGTGIRKLPSGRYQITFRDANGVKHRESFDREKDARAAQDERRTAVRNMYSFFKPPFFLFGDISLIR